MFSLADMTCTALAHNMLHVAIVVVIVLSFLVLVLSEFSFYIFVPCFVVLIIYTGCLLSAR